jgi:oligosaccharide repeat unit polymerase
VTTGNASIRLPYADRGVAGVPLWGLAVALVAAVVALILLGAGLPAAWILLGVCALATAPVVVWALIAGRFFEPLPVIAAMAFLMFVVRPLQLILEWRDLYSHFFPTDPVRRLVLLEGQEIALFIGGRVTEPLEHTLARSIGACALFLVMLLVGYRLRLGRALADRLAGGRLGEAAINLRAAVGIALGIGLAAQVLIIARAGGPGAALEKASDQQAALSDSFVLFFLSGFAFAAVLLWAAWRRPQGRLEWAAFGLSVLAVCTFSTVAGSRARVFLTLFALAVIVHYLWRPWRRRELAVGFVVMLAFVSSFVVFREAAENRSLGEAAEEAWTYSLDPRVIVNDITSFDDVLYATTLYGRTRDHENGQFLVDGVRSFLPRRIDPNKPEGGDIEFRKVVWGEQFGAGRPPTAVGDLYIDWGFPGVAVGAILIGVLARSLLGLLRGPPGARRYRVALYAIALVILYELVVDTFSLALGFVLTLAVPFLVAVHLFGRAPGARPASGSGAA